MINVELTKAEALLYMELIKHNTRELLEQIAQGLDEEVTRAEMEAAAQDNYITNLENEAKKVADLEIEVQQLRARIDAQNLPATSNKIKTPAKRLKPVAPWGYKKDGTPKKRPGRAVKG